MATTRSRPDSNPVEIVIASPLEAELVERIAAAYPGRTRVRYRPDLLPTPRFGADHGDPAFRRTPEQAAEWRALVADAEVSWDFPTDGELGPRQLCPRLRWVQTTSAGVGPKAMALGLHETDVMITTASGIHAAPLTEFVFGALLYHVKQFPRLLANQAARRWELFCAGELRGSTLAIVGPGRIGREVARVGRALGMTVWALARDDAPGRAAALGVDRAFARGELRQMLAGADAVVLATPLTPETEGMIGRAEIAAMRPGVMLVNIARGAVVDEAALIDALREGHIGFAALDVFAVEPLPADSPLWTLPNVLINPHSASTTWGENGRLADIFVANLGHYLDGRYEVMAPLLDKRRGY